MYILYIYTRLQYYDAADDDNDVSTKPLPSRLLCGAAKETVNFSRVHVNSLQKNGCSEYAPHQPFKPRYSLINYCTCKRS